MKSIKSLLFLLALVFVFASVAFAQFNPDDPSNPKTWPDFLMWLIASPFGLIALYQAFRRGINWAELWQSKTVQTALSAVGLALGALLTGGINVVTFAFAVYVSFAFVFLRDGQISEAKALRADMGLKPLAGLPKAQ